MKPFLIDTLGVTSVGTVGTCWGSYFEVHASADALVRAGFSGHPYHPNVMSDYGEDEEAQYELINGVGGAQYFFPTPGDSDTLRPGGLAEQTLDVVKATNSAALRYAHFFSFSRFSFMKLKIHALMAILTGVIWRIRKWRPVWITPIMNCLTSLLHISNVNVGRKEVNHNYIHLKKYYTYSRIENYILLSLCVLRLFAFTSFQVCKCHTYYERWLAIKSSKSLKACSEHSLSSPCVKKPCGQSYSSIVNCNAEIVQHNLQQQQQRQQ